MNEAHDMNENINAEAGISEDIPPPEDHYDNAELMRASDMHDQITVQKNRIIYRELKRDFNPVKLALIGIAIGTVMGMILDRLVRSDSTVAVCAILGALLAVLTGIKRDRNY